MARFSFPFFLRRSAGLFLRFITSAAPKLSKEWFNTVQAEGFFALNVPLAGTNLGCLIQINFVLAFAMYNTG